MVRPRLKNPWELWLGVAFAALGLARLLLGNDVGLGIVFLVLGLAHIATAFLRAPSTAIAAGPEGPGSLAPTPTGRFRATGWPPSKDPDDYR